MLVPAPLPWPPVCEIYPGMPDRPTAEDVRRAVAEDGVEFLFAQFVDMHAKPSAKLVPAAQLEGLLAEGAGFAGFAAGDIGQTPDNPDLIAMPDVGTFTQLPWKPEIGWFACDSTVEGEAWPYCPRTILRRQVERAREAGYELKIGCELEYFLVRRTEDGGIEVADPLDTLEQPCYDIRALTRSFDFVADVTRHVNSLGWEMYATDHEDANGQFEQNFAFADALTTCDRAVFYRYMVEAMAQERGLIATFMPKPFAHLTGNGAHFHMSLWDGETNLFHARPRRRSSGARPERGRLPVHRRPEGAREGLHRADRADRLLLQAPGDRGAGERRNLGSGVRHLWLQQPHDDAAHPRCRAGRGPDRRRFLQPLPRRDGDPGRGPRRDRAGPRPRRADLREHVRDERGRTGSRWGIETLPANLLDATRELEADGVLREALGSVGDEDYVDYFIRCKRREWQAAHEQITQWELDRYLQHY